MANMAETIPTQPSSEEQEISLQALVDADEPRRQAAAMERLFEVWRTNDPEYDQAAWAELQQALEEHPMVMRGIDLE